MMSFNAAGGIFKPSLNIIDKIGPYMFQTIQQRPVSIVTSATAQQCMWQTQRSKRVSSSAESTTHP